MIENFFIDYITKRKLGAIGILKFRRSYNSMIFKPVIFFKLGFVSTRGTFRYFTSGTSHLTNAKMALPLMFYNKSFNELSKEEQRNICTVVQNWYTFK